MKNAKTGGLRRLLAEWEDAKGRLQQVLASPQRGQADDTKLSSAVDAAHLALRELKTLLAGASSHDVPNDLRRPLRGFREETRELSLPPDPYLIDRAAADPFLESLVFPWAEDDTPPYKEEVVQRAQRCEPLLVSKKVHSRLASQLETARRCFIVGLHDAAVVFCRSLLEVAVFEFLYERKDLPRRDARTLPRQEPRNLHRIAERYKLADLLNQLAGYREVPEAALKKARDAKECGDKVLHSKGPGPVIDEQRALKVIRETVSFLERLSDSE